jgi:L-fuculose-phosphate aldolase
MRHIPERRAVIAAARRMSDTGLSKGTSGNVSLRVEEGLLITPTGMPYEELQLEDICELRLDGTSSGWSRKPSSEWRIHADLYRTRPEAGGIVHAHPLYCTTLAILGKEIPAVHYMIALAGGPTVRCSGYATFGSAELSALALEALRDRKAALLANHGMVAVGKSLDEAFKIASEIEVIASQYWHALQVGTPVILDNDEVARVIEKFKTYGRQDA